MRSGRRLACIALGARRAMSTKRIGVLVKDGHAAWPPRLKNCDAELVNAATSEELQAKTSSIDALVWVPGVAAAEVTQAFESLKPRWVHSFPAGVDGLSGFLASEALQSRKVPVTNGKGAFSSSLAEYVIAAIMHFTKQIPRCLTNQKEKKWDPFVMDVVAGKTVGFVGYGHIAQQTAVLCKALGMRIIACRRSSGGEDVVVPSQTYSPNERLKLFAEADYVVCSLPGTAQTQNFCGAQEFGAMKSTGVFVSLGRGAAVDEDALVDVLQKGQIRGAALDVFKEEPLPASSPLWDLGDRILITAHNADLTEDYFDLGWAVFADNYRSFASGEPLKTPIEVSRGY
jgi:sodium/hydrogen exchanger 8